LRGSRLQAQRKRGQHGGETRHQAGKGVGVRCHGAGTIDLPPEPQLKQAR
jgi:hypothetical protein